MRQAQVLVNGTLAGVLAEVNANQYQFNYDTNYNGAPVSLTMPIKNKVYEYSQFPPFFEGLLPEGIMLEALLLKYKLDKKDYFGQLVKVGHDVVGAVTVEEII
jgi:serine/threonine-protein kinase HipA